MTNKKPLVIIDCDPGADDFFALIWALGLHKKGVIKILAITTAGGNVSTDITYANALRACQYLSVTNVPVGKSLVKINSKDASHIHGSDGLGNASQYLPPVKLPKKTLSSDTLLATLVKKYPEVQILTMGPLTNIARLIKKKIYPTRIISMGGAVQVPGNVTPNGEFNIAYDPESADAVFVSPVPCVLLPLNVTTQLTFTQVELKSIKESFATEGKKARNAMGENRAKFLEALALHTIKTNMAFRETAGVEGFLVHDASTVAMLVYPHLFTGKLIPIRVETKGTLTRGQTVTDLRNVATPNAHTFVVSQVDRNQFMEAMVQDFISFFS